MRPKTLRETKQKRVNSKGPIYCQVLIFINIPSIPTQAPTPNSPINNTGIIPTIGELN
jgi:hypothetical protein